MNITIRSVQKSDAAQIVDLLNPIVQTGQYTILEPVTLKTQIDFIENFSKRGIFHVAIDDATQTLLGIQDISPMPSASQALKHVGEIATFVSIKAHRQGIGQALSQTTFQAAREKGFRKICANIRADNTQAQAFYISQGFRIIGIAQKHVHINGTYIDEVLTEKLLF